MKAPPPQEPVHAIPRALPAVRRRRLDHPGPTNILVLSNSQRHGLAAAWPIVLGACAAVAALILLLGLGLGELLRRHPLLQQGLAWRRRLAQLPGLEPVPQRGRHRRRGAAAAPRRARRRGVATGQSQGLDDGPRRAGTVRREGAGQAGRIGLLALLFFLVSLPCLASWALLGVGSARLLRSPSLMKRFNQGMALLLLASAWAALLL